MPEAAKALNKNRKNKTKIGKEIEKKLEKKIKK